MNNLFQYGEFILHSGDESHLKIDCDALSDKDINTIALIISEKLEFSAVVGIPKGGMRLAQALTKYVKNTGAVLIVDDVLTTGNSMTKKYDEIKSSYKDKNIVGVVIFARGKCPYWVIPIFSVSIPFQDV
jgi:orotate phosphoribosyltransferase